MTSISDTAEARSYPPHSTFYLYLAARFVSVLTVQIQSVAVGWHIYSLTSDPFALGLVGLFQFVPMASLILPAGDLADRFERRLIIFGSALLQSASAATLCGLAFTDVKSTWPYYGALMMFGVARAFSAPATQSFLPQLVPPERLPKAIAMSSSSFQVAVIAGPALGGVVYLAGAEATFALSSALSLCVALVLLAMKLPNRRYAAAVSSNMIMRVGEGISFIKRTPILLGAISLDLFAVLLGGATALLPIYARDILHVGPDGLGLMRSAPAVGAAVVALVLTQKPLERKAGAVMLVAVALFGIATIIFGVSRSFWLSLGALGCLGAFDMISVYVRSNLVQLATPDPMRGRVSAVYMLFVSASNELGEFESGITASWFGVVPSVIVGGLGTLAIVGLSIFLFPALARVDRLAEVKPKEIGL